jgi:hypothetical protein
MKLGLGSLHHLPYFPAIVVQCVMGTHRVEGGRRPLAEGTAQVSSGNSEWFRKIRVHIQDEKNGSLVRL